MIPQFVRDADSFMLTTGKEDYYGRNFMRRLALLNGKTRDKYFKIINEVLLIAVPQLENLSFVRMKRVCLILRLSISIGGQKEVSKTSKCSLTVQSASLAFVRNA